MARLKVTEDGQWITEKFLGYELYLKRADFPVNEIEGALEIMKNLISQIKEINYQKIYSFSRICYQFCLDIVLIKVTG